MAVAMSDGQEAVLIIGAIATPVITLAGMVISFLRDRAATLQRNRLEQDVKIVRANTNSNLGESLRIAMISAHLLASQKSPPVPEHLKLAEEAARKYAAHMKQMEDAAQVGASGPKT